MCVFLIFLLYIIYLFIAQNGEVSLDFPVEGFLFICFLGDRGGRCAVSADFWAISPMVCGDGVFPGDFIAGELGKIFAF